MYWSSEFDILTKSGSENSSMIRIRGFLIKALAIAIFCLVLRPKITLSSIIEMWDCKKVKYIVTFNHIVASVLVYINDNFASEVLLRATDMHVEYTN